MGFSTILFRARRAAAFMALTMGIGFGVPAAEDSAWVKIFNGQDVAGWIDKFPGKAAGTNVNKTFRLLDGNLVASPDPLAHVGFGHFYYTKRKYSYYMIRAEYKFLQETSITGYAGWTKQNNGLMLHSPEPATVGGDFPNSLEIQLLGSKNTNESGVVPSATWPVGKTANLCTPGTFVAFNGNNNYTQHCTPAQYPDAWKNTQIPWDKEWSDVTVRLLADSMAQHFIRGQKVFEYTRIRLDNGTPLKEGYVAIQFEGTPTAFRAIEVLDLVGCMDKASPNFRTYFVKNDPADCVRPTGISDGLAAGKGPAAFALAGNTLALPLAGRFALEVRDAQGALVQRESGAGPARMELAPGKQGMFFFSVATSKGVHTGKMIRL